jgi:hypothetical protein
MIQSGDNHQFSLAADFILHTSQSIFLTGKAGTGKTTLLRHIRETTHKNCIVLAPTGVAAINAGGSTIHSFFSIPPYGPFIPENRNELPPGNIVDRRRLFQNVRLGEEKRELINDLELMIIDEVSMVRCDLLDVVDVLLRTFRKKQHLPFGGVQVVFIGDMLQLPPVVKNDDWPILQEFYASPYFFDARVMTDSPPLYIELKKVFRQKDQEFIGLLNNIRNNEAGYDDMELLERRFDPSFQPPSDGNFITLTTHNHKADAINQSELRRLSSPPVVIRGEVKGDFPENALPAEMELELKAGAQVMFIRNDSEEEARYYNGKLATVSRIEDGNVFVNFRDGSEMKVTREIWHNIRYSYDKEKESIFEEALGSFQQLPLRLAWAITVHKSQGLTFEKAVVDVGDSFAPGQVYVALSRCTTLDGLVLRSRIAPASMRNDPRVVEFAARQVNDDMLQQLLEKERKLHQASSLMKAFDFEKLPQVTAAFLEFLPEKKIADFKAALDLGKKLNDQSRMLVGVAGKFQAQLEQLINANEHSDGPSPVEVRVRKAITYFVGELSEGMLSPLAALMKSKAPKTKKYVMQLRSVMSAIIRRIERLQHVYYGDVLLSSGLPFPDLEKHKAELAKPLRGERQSKGASQLATLELLRNGMSIEDIAASRSLAVTTIVGHLIEFVGTGEVRLEQIVPPSKSSVIARALEELEGEPLVVVKGRLGNDYSYSEIKAVAVHRLRLSEAPQKSA